jgi:hypothetical protein
VIYEGFGYVYEAFYRRLRSRMDIGWAPVIGDPTAMGWFTVVAYFGAAIMCARAALATPQPKNDRQRTPTMEPRFWVLTCCIFVFLGFNKQLDLQSLLTAIGRATALSQNWYDERRSYQAAFVVLVGVASIVVLSMALWHLRRSPGSVRLAIVGLAFTCAFVVARAASFHHVDQLLGLTFIGMKWNWLIEFTGIAIVTTAAALYRRPGARTAK